MNELLEQFLSEAREALQGIADMLMQLERAPADEDLMTQLFRLVHTLKGNSGLFEFPEMTRVLHAGEDLMDAVRHGRVPYSQPLADRLLDAMDFVGMLCDDIENGVHNGSAHADAAVQLAAALRSLIGDTAGEGGADGAEDPDEVARGSLPVFTPAAVLQVPEAVRREAFREVDEGRSLWWVYYQPDEECFFQGDDPLHRGMQTPGVLWGGLKARAPWPALPELDAFRCMLDMQLLSTADSSELDEHYRYVPEQRLISAVNPWCLVQPEGDPNGGPVYEDFVADALALLDAGDLQGLERAVDTLLELSSPTLWLSSALRWMQTLLACRTVNQPALRALIESLNTLQAPDWMAVMDAMLDAGGHGAEPGVVADVAEATTAAPAPAAATHIELHGVAAEALNNLVETQREILSLPDDAKWLAGRIKAAAKVLDGCLHAVGRGNEVPALQAAAQAALADMTAAPLAAWLEDAFPEGTLATQAQPLAAVAAASVVPAAAAPVLATAGNGADWPAKPTTAASAPAAADDDTDDDDEPAGADDVVPGVPASRSGEPVDGDVKFGRRSEDQQSARSLKVDQVKIDRLMNLIGEMVVAKNAIPYLANRAETVFGVRDLSREIKAQYAVINRISEEMQDAIMQVRMMPVSFVFQRFPRLVRDTSRRLGKDVNLVLEGQDTAADKNIIESLGDPLVHIVRNSLDHGLEMPEVRKAAGKPAIGTLKIVARQESDRVVIEISDDGKGIDPDVIKRKAYEKGVIDEAMLERITDAEAINLIFAAGFSTAETVSDLSGRGVGMDVVRTAIERVNGAITLDSEKGKGTRIRLSLPLSMAVTNVMTIETDGQVFGVPMDMVLETVRVPRSSVRQIKQSMATVLRDRVVPLKSLNGLLGLSAAPLANESDELAVLIVRVGEETVGLLVDEFRETADIILKPLAGVLAGLKSYSGSALMGDGSVLMVLNVKEML
ncbi:MAG: chemotaxis protein CheA [Burkholderiales bacterium PBB6]|nr:MAG: chemotaxis protein CheA [Burkholderiales bacterium PBB6]